MNKQGIYYPRTSYSQREKLFQVWEETQSVAEACNQARISKSTFYYWKPRYEEKGYEGLKEVKKRGPEKGIQVSEEIQTKVVRMKEAHPEWGKQRIVDELAKGNGWVPLVSVNTVRRILEERGLWEVIVQEAEKKSSSQPIEQQRRRDRASM